MSDPQYYPSEYAFVPAIPLQYLDDPSTLTGRPVPLIDLFPVFSSSPSVTKSTAVPIVAVCTDPYSLPSLDSTTSSLAPCVLDRCRGALDKVTDASATYEALLSAVNGDNGPSNADLQTHFNSYNALEECTIRQCPTEYFTSRSSICISLRHPYFVKNNIYLPALPPHQRSSNLSFSPGLHFGDYLARVQSSEAASRLAPISKDNDLGILLPALPADFPCDPTCSDQSSGAILHGNAAKVSSGNKLMTSAGTWVTIVGGTDQWALSRNASDTGFVHSWMAKSTLFRGQAGLGEVMAYSLRNSLATMPANMYSLGHCPRSTGWFTASKLTGEACQSSMECVFSMCIKGQCAEATSGKRLDVATALRPMREPSFRERDRAEREEAQFWMLLVGGLMGGLLALRAFWLAAKRRRVVKKRDEMERRRAERQQPAFHSQE